MHYTYLLINFLTILFPLLLSFDSRVRYVRNWRFVLPALAISGLIFLVWDHLFTVFNVWSFNPDYISGIYLFQLPVEEILFFVTVPFACIFIYECLNYYIAADILSQYSRWISIVLIALSILFVGLYPDRVYTLITFGLLAVTLIVAEFVQQSTRMSRFYLAYIISLFPFYIVNGFLTSIPVVMYNDSENIGIRVWTIPFEDHFYSLAMLLINIMLFDYFRKKHRARNGAS